MVSKYAMPGELYEKIPAFINGSWSEISYSTKEEFIVDLEKNYFKEVGEYGFTEKTLTVLFSTQNFFLKNGYYCNEPYNSKGFITFWDFEKLKSRKGLFIIDGENKWYFSRDIYFWLNFLPIFNKKKKRDDFPNLTDAHIRMDLYEFIAELKGLHGIITKKRQFGSSYYHAAKLINRFWFEPSTILQMGASLDLYVNGTKGTWRYLNSYRNWLNKETAWFRPIKGGDGNWKQSIDEINPITKQSVETGRQGVLTSTTFERSATNGVGGAKSIFYHEEAGIASKMDTTYEFMRSAVEDGNESTGFFVAAGSVGDLSECEPLKKYMYSAEANGFYAVNNKLIDSEMPEAPTGLFISEVHAMTGFIDEYGNSDVEGALTYLEEQKEIWRNTLAPKSYAIRCSQRPTYLNEAFKFRGESIMPLTILESEEKRIIRGEVPYEIVELEYDQEDETGQKILILPSKKEPISEFPINPKTEDKTGAIVMFQRPIKNLIPLTTYYASVDPVGQGKAEHVNNKVYTPTGLKRIGDLKVGDLVIASNGKAVKVKGVFPQGKINLFDVIFNDGFKLTVGNEHLWKVFPNPASDKKDGHVLSTKQLLDKNLKIDTFGTGINSKKKYKTSTFFKRKNGASQWQIPISEPIIFNRNKVPIDSYLLGLILGDGGISQKSIYFSTEDSELLESIKKVLPKGIELKFSSKCSYRLSSSTSRNTLTQKLRKLGLMGKSSIDKFIPESYMISSVKNRLSLLQGLLDTDGYSGNNGAEFYSISEKLANQVVQLSQSLGGLATIRKKITKTGVGFVFIVRVKLPKQFNPFRLKRKAQLYKPNYVFSRYISEINYVGREEAVCISVDSTDNLYVSENAIVTHNTITSNSLACIYVYRNSHFVSRNVDGYMETSLEGDEVVCVWTGRYDDINDTHDQIIKIILLYQAWTLCENNVPLLIDEMKIRRLQKYLVPKKQFSFSNEFDSRVDTQFYEYGWRNTGTVFDKIILNYLLKYLVENIYEVLDENGEVKYRIKGVSRIKDVMVIKEMLAYFKGLNVDRIVTLAALLTFVELQRAHRRNAKSHVTETDDDENLDNPNKMTKLNKSPFNNLGGGNKLSVKKSGKRFFKNFK